MPGQGAISFNLASSFGVVLTNPAFDFGSSPFSVELWFKDVTTHGNDYFIGNTNATSQGWGFRCDSAGRPQLAWATGSGTAGGVSASINTASPDWHHWCGIKDAAGTRIYRDGGTDAASAAGAGVTVPASTSNLAIGGRAGGGSPANGMYSEVRIWSRALTLAEYQSRWNQRATGTETGLVACWPCDEDSGNVARELVAGRSATLQTARWTHPASPFAAVTPPDGGGEPTTPELIDEGDFLGRVLVDIPAYYYTVRVDVWPDEQPAIAVPMGSWLPRLGWVEYLGADQTCRQIERLQFSDSELWPLKRPATGLYVHVEAGVGGHWQAWNLV